MKKAHVDLDDITCPKGGAIGNTVNHAGIDVDTGGVTIPGLHLERGLVATLTNEPVGQRVDLQRSCSNSDGIKKLSFDPA